jgi:hypothetical protein
MFCLKNAGGLVECLAYTVETTSSAVEKESPLDEPASLHRHEAATTIGECVFALKGRNAMSEKSLQFVRRTAWSMVVLLTSFSLLPHSQALGQSQQGSAASPSKSIGLFAYGKKSQSPEQQSKDENECFASAKQNTGIDPQAPPPQGKTAEQKAAEQKAAADNAPKKKGGRARGAARGAAGGAAIGAIADDEAGKGASAGAVAGTMRGGAQQRKANASAKQQAAQQTAQAQQQEEAQAKAQHQEKIDTFKRAYTACMEARDYSVK